MLTNLHGDVAATCVAELGCHFAVKVLEKTKFHCAKKFSDECTLHDCKL